MRGVFVTATDTGVGKTVLAAAICSVLRARGEVVAACKPAVTGLAEPEPGVLPDHALLAACTGQQPEQVTPAVFAPAVSPHLAAAAAGTPLDPATLEAFARAAAPPEGVLVAEGVGGLLVPLTLGYLVRDFAIDLGLPVVIAARPGLGTINHTLLTVEAARAAGLRVAGIALTPWPEEPTIMERSNRLTIARLAGVEVSALPVLPRPDPRLLAAAGARLPLDDWIGATG